MIKFKRIIIYLTGNSKKEKWRLKYTFGPVKSRRFGLSLGIDLSPDKKSCNFDCLYCELGKADTVRTIENPPPPEEILKEVEEFISRHGYPDVLTITANGEPTLYPYLDRLIEGLNRFKGSSKTLILTNGSTIGSGRIRNLLKNLDMVKISLDSALEGSFKKVNRPSDSVSLQEIIQGIKRFRQEFSGSLIIEILLVRNVNDSIQDVKALAEILREIKPDRVDIGTIDRPPAYRVKPLTDRELFSIAGYFDGLPVNVVARQTDGLEGKIRLSEEQIVSTLRRRPYTYEDIQEVFDEETQKRVRQLIKKGILREISVNNSTFISP